MRRRPPPDPADPTPPPASTPILTIRPPRPNSDPLTSPACHIGWDAHTWTAPPHLVRATAHDLTAAADWCTIATSLLDHGQRPATIAAVVRDCLPAQMGHRATLTVVPAVNPARRRTAIRLGHGRLTTTVTPHAARTLAAAWHRAAEACDTDTLLDEALAAVGRLDASTRALVFAYLAALRDHHARPRTGRDTDGEQPVRRRTQG